MVYVKSLIGGAAAHTVLTELDNQKLLRRGMAFIESTASCIFLTFLFLYSQNGSCMPLTSKFLVQPSNTECGGLETAYKDSRQVFKHFDRMFEHILKISLLFSFLFLTFSNDLDLTALSSIPTLGVRQITDFRQKRVS